MATDGTDFTDSEEPPKALICSDQLKMPTVLRIGPYRFHFFSDERNEPAHIHARNADGECKFWLDPIALARNRGIRPHDLREIERLVFEYQTLLRTKYNEYHSGYD